MLNMSINEENEAYFITDILVCGDNMIIKRADGTVSEEKFSHHNLGFYRTQMIENAKENIGPYLDVLSKDSFFTFVKRYSAIILGVVSLYFLYNIDIHIIMKILITLIALIGEIGYFFLNEIYISIMGSEVIECLATEYYLKNIENFRFFDQENYTDGYIVPPEDISRYHLTCEMLEQICQGIKDFKSEGILSQDIQLSYKRDYADGKSML